MDLLNAIVWNPPVKLGFVRYYSLCWIVGLLAAYLLTRKIYRQQKIQDEYFDPLFLYCFVGIMIGCRVGHCLIYEAGYYLGSFPHFVEMLLPIKFMGDGFSGMKVVGYQGLASHGGALGLIAALLLYCRKYQFPVLRLLDYIGISGLTTCSAIRLGNLMNSEILGKPTGTDWGFIFCQQIDPATGLGETFARHPAQLYEAVWYLLLFFVAWYLYKRIPRKLGTGFFFGFSIAMIFLFRIFVEFYKDGVSNSLAAQWLSVPYVVAGIACMVWSFRHDAKPLPKFLVTKGQPAKTAAKGR